MADAYGLDDFSLLSGPQQDTARTIQRSFDASLAGRNRNLERYNLATSGPMLTEYANDSALKRAQVTAGILNQNQQLQNVIDASHRTPHGFMENLAAYAPAIGGLSRLYPMLFGTNNSFSQNGLIPTAWQGAKDAVHWTQFGGNTYGLDSQGNVVYSLGKGGVTGQGNEAGWPGETAGYQYTPSGAQPMDFGGGYNWNSGYDVPSMDTSSWTSGFDLGGL